MATWMDSTTRLAVRRPRQVRHPVPHLHRGSDAKVKVRALNRQNLQDFDRRQNFLGPAQSRRSRRMTIAHRFIGGIRQRNEVRVRETDGRASKGYWMSSYQSSASRTLRLND